MKEHYNLYYLFLEDKLKNPMPEKRRLEMRSALEKFYKSLKPPCKRISASSEKNKKITKK